MSDAPDGRASSSVTDHLFTPPVDRPWGRCCVCALSEAAHVATGAEHALTAPFRCPYCVHLGIDPCHHGRQRALDLEGKPIHPEVEPEGVWCGTPLVVRMQQQRDEKG